MYALSTHWEIMHGDINLGMCLAAAEMVGNITDGQTKMSIFDETPLVSK